jgi:hypothetical protein
VSRFQDLDTLRTFYLGGSSGGPSLFEAWEQGGARGDSVTPSTYCAAYRSWMRGKLMRLLEGSEGALLSLGCGNAVIEAELRQCGCAVVAVDILPEAVTLARSKGVPAVVADASTWEPPHRAWDLVYADGLLGHLYDADQHALPSLERFGSWLRENNGSLVVSNDMPPDSREVKPADAVPGFYWLSASYIVTELENAGLVVTAVDEFAYDRPLSGKRTRAVVTAKSSTQCAAQ